jgi:nitroreductase
MNVSEAIMHRRSIRHFMSTPVSETILREILEVARWAPSGSNIQAWRIIAVAGEHKEHISRMAIDAQATLATAADDPYPIYPPNLWEPLRSRRYKLAEDMYAALKIPREDKAARLRHVARNYEFFGAPVALFFVIDRRLGYGQWAHLGMLIQSVALAAEDKGLGSCMQEAWASFRPQLAQIFGLGEHEMVYCGMALGYPDRTKPVNQFPRERLGVDELTEFRGFAS